MGPDPEIEVFRYELRPLIDPDPPAAPICCRQALQRVNDIATALWHPHIPCRRQAAAIVDDGQDTDLPAVKELIGQDVHRPAVVRRCGGAAILAKLCLHPAFLAPSCAVVAPSHCKGDASDCD